jgi:hypothetical protein
LFRIAGTTGAVLTCPLEVVKTRFQSSYTNYYTNINLSNPACSTHFNTASTIQATSNPTNTHHTVAANFCTTTPNTNVNTLILKNHTISRTKTQPKFGIGIFLQLR